MTAPQTSAPAGGAFLTLHVTADTSAFDTAAAALLAQASEVPAELLQLALDAPDRFVKVVIGRDDTAAAWACGVTLRLEPSDLFLELLAALGTGDRKRQLLNELVHRQVLADGGLEGPSSLPAVPPHLHDTTEGSGSATEGTESGAER